MASVRSLTYLGVRGPDLDAWRAFACEVLGLQSTDESTDDRLVLRMDDRSHRLTVERGDPGISRIGFELGSRAELDELVGVLQADGLEVTMDADLAAARHVKSLARCQDPAGNQIELVVGHLTAKTAFASPRGVRFKTEDQGLGHVFLIVPDFEAAWHFYVDLLGFRMSDTIDLGFAEGTFLHCNGRHHTVALVGLPGVSALAHLMLEVDDVDAVGRAYDIVGERGITISMTLGVHTNDHMFSFYVQSPSGFEVEYGTNGRTVDDATWTVGHYDAASFWGHKREAMPAL